MATYKQPLKTVAINTMNGTFDAIDTADGVREGTYAVEAFASKKTIKTANGYDDGSYDLIPFHAIREFRVTQTTADATRTDAYCK